MTATDVTIPTNVMCSIRQHSLFEEVQKRITEKIRAGVWKQGEAIPNELELADLFGVSQGTVRRALHELESQGVLLRRQGKGTFVASFKQNLESLRERINWFVPDDPCAPASHNRLVLFEVVDAPLRVAHLMHCEETEKLIHIRRELYYGDGEIVTAFDDTYLKAKDFPGLTAEVIEKAHSANLYVLYEEKYGYFITSMEDLARAVLLNPYQAAKAHVSLPYPAISLQRRAYTLEGRLIELRFIVNVTDTQHMRLRSVG